ncbi:MAG: hypothetical protein U9N02_01230 [Campylobacterota bacterium]|nr:hypothetical protein [Campylobacterota bacterium]
MLLGGTDLGFFSINMLVFFSVFMYKGWYRIDSFIAPMFIVLFVFLLYGIFGPVIREFESFGQAITSSKSFLYFSIFFYIFVRKDEIDIYKIFNFIKFLGLYLTTWKVLWAISPSLSSMVTPPEYQSTFGDIGYYVRVSFPTYIGLATLIYYAEWQQKMITGKKFLFYFAFLMLGNQLCAHAAYTGMVFVGIAGIYSIWHVDSVQDSFQTIKKIIFLIVLVIVTLLSSPKLQDTLLGEYQAISSGEDGALASREKFNRFRWEAINDNPLAGLGFIHKSAPIMKVYKSEIVSRFTERLDVLDSGYVDVLVKFGYGGMYLFLFVFTLYIYSVFKQENPNPYALGAAVHMLTYYPVNYTWAVFTYPHGIIPMVITFYMIYYFRPKIPLYK